jgi:hypothetical protein
VGQSLQTALELCNNGTLSSLLTGTVPGATAFNTQDFSLPAATATATAATATGTNAAASATGTATGQKTSGGDKVVALVGVVAGVAVLGGAFIGI